MRVTASPIPTTPCGPCSSGSLPCEGREGWGGVSSKISSNREHPLPASPCLRRGRGQDKSSRLKPILQGLARQPSPHVSALRRANSQRHIPIPPQTTGNATTPAPPTPPTTP